VQSHLQRDAEIPASFGDLLVQQEHSAGDQPLEAATEGGSAAFDLFVIWNPSSSARTNKFHYGITVARVHVASSSMELLELNPLQWRENPVSIGCEP